ncbi:unnamed protein product [Brassica rapa subsp. trilocularis]
MVKTSLPLTAFFFLLLISSSLAADTGRLFHRRQPLSLHRLASHSAQRRPPRPRERWLRSPNQHPPLFLPTNHPLVRSHLGSNRLLPLQRQILLRHRRLRKPSRVQRSRWRNSGFSRSVRPPPRWTQRLILLRCLSSRRFQRSDDSYSSRRPWSLSRCWLSRRPLENVPGSSSAPVGTRWTRGGL